MENESQSKKLLVVTSEKGILQSSTQREWRELLECFDQYRQLKSKQGILVHLYIPDSSDPSDEGFPRIDGELSGEKICKEIRSIELERFGASPFDYVLIIGNRSVIPTFTVDNPAADVDAEIETDAPFGSCEPDEESILIPDRAVGRIPFPGDSVGVKEVISYLGTEPQSSDHPLTFGLSAKVWKRESQKVYSLIASEDIRTSPPISLDNFDPQWISGRQILYFNVHGSKTERYWYGQEGLTYPKVLSPEIVSRASPRDCLVFTEACYGAYVWDRSVQESVALQFMWRGARVLIGSTAVAYGSPSEDLSEADLLAYFFFKRLNQGEVCGDAFREAKVDLAAEMMKRQGYLDGDDRKTLLEFNLFGDPTFGRVGVAEGQVRAEDMVRREVIDSIKRAVCDRFPEMEGVEPVVAEHSGGGLDRVVSKLKVKRPDVAPRQKTHKRLFIASFHRTVSFEGRQVERVVRITFDEDGNIVKVVTSK